MNALTIEKCFDYSVGPEQRIKLTINCDEFPKLWEDAPRMEFMNSIQDIFKEMENKYNYINLSIVLLNDKPEIDDWGDENYNIDLDTIFSIITSKFQLKSVWIYSQNDFLSLLNISGFHWCLTDYYCKSELYFVCGSYDSNNNKIIVNGENCEFAVKPLYRQSFNQKIWKVNRHHQRDVTAKMDSFYKIWKNSQHN